MRLRFFHDAKSDDFFCIKTEAWFGRKHWISATGVWISVLDDLQSEWITCIMPLLHLKASIETLNVHLDAQHLWMKYKSGLHFILWLMFVAELNMIQNVNANLSFVKTRFLKQKSLFIKTIFCWLGFLSSYMVIWRLKIYIFLFFRSMFWFLCSIKHQSIFVTWTLTEI